MMLRPIQPYPLSRIVNLCVAFVCVFNLASLLPQALNAQSFTARIYGQDDGLENQAIVQLAQDATGHLWIATENGVFRYDGAHFIDFGRNQGLPDPRIYNIHIDQLGTVWVATRAGLAYFDGERFHEVKRDSRSIRVGVNSKLASNSRGELLVASANEGLLSIERDGAKDQWTVLNYADRHPTFPSGVQIHGITLDQQDRLWYGCGTSICNFAPPDREPSGATPEHTAVLVGVPPLDYDALLVQQTGQQKGRLWARSSRSIITWMPGDIKVREVSSLFPGSQNTIYRNLTEDRLGNVLTQTTDGFATWDGNRWTETVNTTQGPIDGATSLLSDHEGGIWIGTQGKGLLQAIGYRHWDNYTLAQGLKSQLIFGVALDKNRRLWLGNPRGIDILPPGASKPIVSPLAREPDASWIEHLLPTPDGGMWAASLNGHLYHIDPHDRIDQRAVVPSDIKRVRLDSNGSPWIATISGLFHLECLAGKPTCTTVKFEGAFGGNDFPEAMRFDKQGSLWIASHGGLSVLRGGKVTHVTIQGFAAGFTELAIAPDQTIWLAGRFPGLIHLRVNADTANILDTHADPELASDYIEFLETDARGRIWAGTDHGVNVLDGHQTTLINMQDGLIWNDTDWNSFFEESDGSVWIGTSGGVSHLLDPDAILNRPPFNADLDRPRYGAGSPSGKVLKPGSTTPWDRSTFVIGFSGLTYRDNRTLIYHYRLEGLDPQNIETRATFARFQQLPPGTYNFVVVAEDRGHHAFSKPASFSFTLSPPWWRTGLFYDFEGLASFAIVFLIWRWSNMALLAQRKRLQRLVDERTADLQKVAVTDALTGLLNRGAIMTVLAKEAASAKQSNRPLCVAIVDLDHFKRINDTLGHAAGDEVLREAARRLAEGVRSTDFVGRYGGEEFLIIFRDVQREIGRERCEAIRQAVCISPVRFEEHELSITASIGLAWTCRHQEVEDAFVARADRALYMAKERGRNRVELAPTEPETEPETVSA